MENHPDAELLRPQNRETMLAIAYAIGWAADPVTMASHPTLARCMTVSGRSRRTVQRWWRWLEGRSLLYVLEPGTTPRFRPAILYLGTEGNLAREWRLTLPVHPAGTPGGCSRSAPLRAREREPGKARGSAADSPARPSPWRAQAGSFPLGQTPQRRAEALAAAERLRAVHPVLRRMSPRMLRHQLRPWFGAGYSPADVLAAIERRPSGEPHEHGDRVRHPALWLRARLAWWLSPEGSPVSPHSARLAEAARQHRAEVGRQRDALRSASPSSPASVRRHATAIRRQLGWT